MSQVPHETVRVQGSVRRHRIARVTVAAGRVPDRPAGLLQDVLEHRQRGRLGVVDGATGMILRSDVEDEGAGVLAFDFAEDAARVLKMGVVVHAGRNALR